MNLNLILMLSAMLASLTGAVSGDRAVARGGAEAVQGVSVAVTLAKQVQAIAAQKSPVLAAFGGNFGLQRAAVAPINVRDIAPALNILTLFAQRRE